MLTEQTFLTTEERIMLALRELYRRCGYTSFKMSRFEEYELYLRNKEFLIGDRIITFTEDDGRLLALKPDVTLSIVKNFRGDETGVKKYCYNERVYRHSLDKHAYSEILQSGVECLGDIDTVCTAEVLMLAISGLRTISENFVLEISHMGLMSGLIASLSLTDDVGSALIGAVAEKNKHELRSICLGAGLSEETAAMIESLTSLRGTPKAVLAAVNRILLPESVQDCLRELHVLCDILDENGRGNFILDLSLVSDTHYYSGVVFRGFVDGVPERVLSGGRYDHLMRRMQKRGGAIGFAVYLDVLERFYPDETDYDGDVFYLYGASEAPDAVARIVSSARRDTDMIVFSGREMPRDLRVKKVLHIVNGEVLDHD